MSTPRVCGMQRKIALLDDVEERYGEFRILYVNGQVFLTESVDLLNHSTRQGSLFDVWDREMRHRMTEATEKDAQWVEVKGHRDGECVRLFECCVVLLRRQNEAKRKTAPLTSCISIEIIFSVHVLPLGWLLLSQRQKHIVHSPYLVLCCGKEKRRRKTLLFGKCSPSPCCLSCLVSCRRHRNYLWDS